MTRSVTGTFATLFAVGCLVFAGISVADDKQAKQPDNTPPEGFTALFNGKDLTGWKGLLAGPLDNPYKRAEATPEQLKTAQEAADKHMREHWAVKDGVLVFDGKGASLAT